MASLTEAAPLRTLDLCSGIGGFAYGLRDVAKTVAFCEIDEACREVLRARQIDGLLATCPIFEDVTHLLWDEHGGDDVRELEPELLTAGFPCQDVSLANPTATGLHGTRSRLFFDIAGLAGALPSLKHVFLENSPGLARGGGLELVRFTLERAGFPYVVYGRFAASSVGAPHVRRRVFVLASKDQQGLRAVVSARMQPQSKVIAGLSPETLLGPSADEPPVVPRTLESRDESHARHCMLGNAVVPQVAALALDVLSEELARGCRGDVQWRCPRAPKPDFPIELLRSDDPSGATFQRRKGIGTPTVQWQHAARMQDCVAGLYGPAVYALRQTWDYARTCYPYGRTLVTPWDLREHFTLNPSWTERIMGFPRGWTDAGALLPSRVPHLSST